jgi:hypothetical protein
VEQDGILRADRQSAQNCGLNNRSQVANGCQPAPHSVIKWNRSMRKIVLRLGISLDGYIARLLHFGFSFHAQGLLDGAVLRHGVHTSVNAARRSACATYAFLSGD